MRHVEKALEMMKEQYRNHEFDPTVFIDIENKEDVKGVAPIVKFAIQSDPIKEVGVNGCQAADILKYVGCLFESLNKVFPCEENVKTIMALQDALYWQQVRTEDREFRGVEGENKA
jgi:hypothetical protein